MANIVMACPTCEGQGTLEGERVNQHAFYSPIEQYVVTCPTCEGLGNLNHSVNEFSFCPSDAHNDAYFEYVGNRQHGQEASELLSASITRETPYKKGCWVNCQDGREHAWLLAVVDFYDLHPAPSSNSDEDAYYDELMNEAHEQALDAWGAGSF